MKKIMLFMLFAVMLVVGCDESFQMIPDVSDGLLPIYSENDEWKNVSVEASRPMVNDGIALLYEGVQYIDDEFYGIHVQDVSDPLVPQRIAFLSIPGLYRFDIRNDSLIAGNNIDAVIFDVSDPMDIQFIGRVEDAYIDDGPSKIPSSYFGFFECPDKSKGDIIGWTRGMVTEPQCWR